MNLFLAPFLAVLGAGAALFIVWLLALVGYFLYVLLKGWALTAEDKKP